MLSLICGFSLPLLVPEAIAQEHVCGLQVPYAALPRSGWLKTAYESPTFYHIIVECYDTLPLLFILNVQ